jgi:TolA-binding protein
MKGAWNMSKIKTICGLVLTGVFLWMATTCFADAAAQIGKADKCVKAGNYSKAEEIYKAVIQNEGKSDSALQAQRKLIGLYIHESKNTEAQAGFDKMLADYAGNPKLAEEIYWVGRGYRIAGDYSKAASLYQQVVQQYPGSPFANKSRINIQNLEIWSLIKAGQIEQARTQFGKMVQDFSGDSYLAEAMFWTARKFRQANQYEDSQNIYAQIVQQYPTDKFADKAKEELSNSEFGQLIEIRQLIEKGEHDKAVAAVDKLLTDDPNNPNTLMAALRIGELYQVKSFDLDKKGLSRESQDSLARAAAIWELMIGKASGSPRLAEICCSLGNYYYQTGNYAKSIECYKKALDGYPDYKGRWNAQFMIGRNCEAMKKAGTMPGAEADGKIKEAYEQLLAEYPDCQAAKYAHKWLGR